MSKYPCSDAKTKLKKGLWSPEEDDKLIKHIKKYGPGCWSAVPKQAGLQRCGKSCRLRWINYLRPDLKRGAFSPQEEEIIIALQAELGNRWSQIATRLPGRTDNEIKNFWNSCLKRHLSESATNASTIHGENVGIREGPENTGRNDIIDAAQRHITVTCDNPSIETIPRLPSVFRSAYNDPVLRLLSQGTDSSCAKCHDMESGQHVISNEGSMRGADMAAGDLKGSGSTNLFKLLHTKSESLFSTEFSELSSLMMANSTMCRQSANFDGDQEGKSFLKWGDLVLPAARSSSTHTHEGAIFSADGIAVSSAVCAGEGESGMENNSKSARGDFSDPRWKFIS